MNAIWKLLLGYFAVILILIVAGVFISYRMQQEIRISLARSGEVLAASTLERLDQSLDNRIKALKHLVLLNRPLRAAIARSNRDFMALGDDGAVQAHIDAADREWVQSKPDEPTALMTTILDSPVSELLREELRLLKKEHGYAVFGEIFVTNLFGANVAQTGRTSDYRQDDEAWWKNAGVNGTVSDMVELDKSAGVYSLDISLRIEGPDGAFLGVLKAVLNIKELHEIIDASKPRMWYRTFFAQLVNREGRLIYRQDSPDHFGRSLVGEAAVGELMAGRDGFVIEQPAGTNQAHLRVFARSKGYRGFAGLGWAVILNFEVSEIFAPVYRLRTWMVLVAVVSTLLACVVGLLLSLNYGRVQADLRQAAEDLRRENEERARAEHTARVARQTAEHANQAKSRFLANMSHELRTPLNAIIGYSELLREDAIDGQRADEAGDLERIHSAGRNLLDLINDILDLSKIEADSIELDPEQFDLMAVVEDIEATVAPLMKKGGNTFRVEGVEGAGDMVADLTRVRQILLNLLSNAAKFTEQGTVTLAVSRVQHDGRAQIEFRLSDTGIGMTEQQIENVYDPFKQADSSTTRKYGGTGLGLTICKRFCEMMGGDIGVESEPGRGTVFTVRLPADADGYPQADAVQETLSPDHLNDRDVVLVIDDDAAVRALLGRALARENYNVITAADAEAGIESARRARPMAILLDVMMPKVDGWTALSILKRDPELADIPVIMQTIVADRNLGFALGASDYLIKPVPRDVLVETLARYRSAPHAGSILMVEDTEAVREMVKRTLSQEGWTIEEAENGRVALERLAVGVPDVILLDLMMPEMDGFEFLDAIRQTEAWSAIPVVVMTAKDLSDDDRIRLNGHVQRIVEKGHFDEQELIEQLRRALRSAPLHRP